MAVRKYTVEYNYKWLPERRKLKPEGKYTIPPASKYNLWDFIKDILSKR